jgi:lysylphosphatidylglycerol synthetase-like protein (DUF2156 family)
MTMMSKKCCIAQAAKKFNLIAILFAIVLVAGIVVGAIFGLNKEGYAKSYQALTVQVSGVSFETQNEAVKNKVEEKLASVNADYAFKSEADISTAEKEYVYYFAIGEDLTEAKKVAKQAIIELSGNVANAVNGGQVSVSEEVVIRNVPAVYTVRAVIAAAVIAVLAFVYTALRYKLVGGIVTAIAVALSAGLSFAVSALTRIPASVNVVAIFAFAALLAAVMTVFNLAKAHDFEETEAAKTATEEEKTAASIAVVSTVGLAAALVIAFVIALAFGPSRWLALHAIIAVVVATAVALFVTPALYAILKKKLTKKTGYAAFAAEKAEEVNE